ncbi:MAG: hypothetical protein WBN29_13585 [Polyangiales bacterium]
MTMYRRDLLIGTGAVMTVAVFAQACGRAKPGPRTLDAIKVQEPPIIEALRYGITAPSAHNTQPWLIELVSDTEARVFLDKARLLPATDPPGRQVHMSHGTFVELMAISATHFGYRADVDLLPEGTMTDEELGTKPTARIRLVEAPDVSVDDLFPEVLTRRTSRLPHEGPMVTSDELATIVSQIGPSNVETTLLTEDQLHDALSIVRRAMEIEVNDYELYDETRQWFRFSKREIREHRDGLSIGTAGLTGFSAGSANLFLTSKNFHKEKNRKRYLETFGKAVESTRGLLTMTSPSNTLIDWIETGRAYARAQLSAEMLGLRFQPVSQVLQEYPQMDDLRREFDALVGIEPPQKVQMLVRVGRTPTPGLSPRRTVDGFLGGTDVTRTT